MSNQPRFEVFPEAVDSGHETFVRVGAAYHPSGDDYTVAEATCDSCDWSRRGDEADVRDAAAGHESAEGFYWRFKDANGRITFIGGESFTRREDAHRAIEGVRRDVGVCGACRQGAVNRPPIVDLDENDDVIGARD